MAKITQMPALPDSEVTGDETLPVVKGGVMRRILASSIIAKLAKPYADAAQASAESMVGVVGKITLQSGESFPLVKMADGKVPLWISKGQLNAYAVSKTFALKVLSFGFGLFDMTKAQDPSKFPWLKGPGGSVLAYVNNGAIGIPKFDVVTVKRLAAALSPLIGGGAAVAKPTTDAINGYGQSNAAASLSYSQTWRAPWPVFGEYPPGFTGTLDGPSLITTAQVGNTRTIASDLSGLIPLAGNPVYGTSSEGIGHGMCDSIVSKYPGRQLVMFGRPIGGVPISYLDKPTDAEISAGTTSPTNEALPIPSTSAEAQMKAAGQNMSRILDYTYASCATPYFQNMWLIAKANALLAAEGKLMKVTLAWLHGEANSGDAAYPAKLAAFYDQYKADVMLITGQTEVTMLLQEPQYAAMAEQDGPTPQAGFAAWKASGYLDSYAPGGVNSAYTPEAARTNNYIDLNTRQTKIADEALGTTPARRIYNVGPTYPFSSLVHRHPHAARNEGENFGKVFCKVEIERQAWKPLEPISYWYDATSIYVRFHVPKGGIQFVASPNAAPAKAGMPYGLEHSAGAIQAAKVTIIGNDLLRITPDVPPASGQSLKYVASCRTGDLCDRDDTAPLYTDRASNPNVLRNYCVPFNLTL